MCLSVEIWTCRQLSRWCFHASDRHLSSYWAYFYYTICLTVTFNCVHLHIFKMKCDPLIKCRRDWFFFLLNCDDNRQFDFQKFQPQIFLASLTSCFLGVNLQWLHQLFKNEYSSIMFCLLYLSCFSACLDAFGPWDLNAVV